MKMSLSFPNFSRCYDQTRDAVRFWGYQSAMEYSFFVTADALRGIHAQFQRSEAGCLEAFDAHRELICGVAVKVHARGSKHSYERTGADFR